MASYIGKSQSLQSLEIMSSLIVTDFLGGGYEQQS